MMHPAVEHYMVRRSLHANLIAKSGDRARMLSRENLQKLDSQIDSSQQKISAMLAARSEVINAKGRIYAQSH